MKTKNISIAVLMLMIYEALAQLPLLNRSGGMDILSEALMENFVYLHFIVLLLWYMIGLISKKPNRGILIQLLFVLSIIVCIIAWRRIQWYKLPKEERNRIEENQNKIENTLYNVGCKDGKLCFQNYKGEVIIPCLYDAGNPFENDTITSVLLGAKWGYINRTGKTIIPFQFNKAQNFSEGLAAVKKDSLWGFIDLAGRWIILPKYPKIISGFYKGKASVELKGKVIKIDKQGNSTE